MLTLIATALLDMKERDVNWMHDPSYTACGVDVCDNEGICVEDFGPSFTCSCRNGFSGALCEIDLNFCQSGTCLNGGTCIEGIVSTTSCTCVQGFTGQNCGTPLEGKTLIHLFDGILLQ